MTTETRFEVRPRRVQGDDGWGVYDTAAGRFVGGWFAFHIRAAAEQVAAYHEAEGDAAQQTLPPVHQTPVTAPETWPRLGCHKVTQTMWMVPSLNTAPGAYWSVEWFPGNDLRCSCPHGQANEGVPVGERRACRHVRLVVRAEQMGSPARPVAPPAISALCD